MTTEFLTDKIPPYIHNKHTTYENTVLQEHSSIVSGLQDTSTNKTLIEAQGRLLIGLCLKDKAHEFIDKKYNEYYEDEYAKVPGSETTPDRIAISINRTWLRLITEAISTWIAKYKVDGSKAKIAIVDDVLPDGRRILEPDELIDMASRLLPIGYKVVKEDTKPDAVSNNILVDDMAVVDFTDDDKEE
jgi:hypothetical protein